jgi:RHS repeat-associated protein
VVTSYLYNALEQLASRAVSSPLTPVGTTHYIYDLDGYLIAEAFGTTAATAVLVREYIWLDGMPVMAIDGVNTATPTLLAVHTDHLTRPIRMTNATKTQVWNAQWLPHGQAHAITGTATQNLRFPGQYFLIESGLAYNWHRFYDPTTGRYTQPDPLGFVDGPSRYAYAMNSPLMRVDRRGLFDQGLAAGGTHLGHSDFPGSSDLKNHWDDIGPFDYNKEDTDGTTSPFNWPNGTARHFRSQLEVETDLSSALHTCDLLQYERLMHQGQDYFVHAKNGYGPIFGHLFSGHGPDHDDSAWAEANLWSKKWFDMWSRRCDCTK